MNSPSSDLASARWQFVPPTDHESIRRYLVALRQKFPELTWQRFDESLAAVTMELSCDRGWLYHFGAAAYDIALLFRFNPKRNRYSVCPLIWGNVDPREALEQLVKKGFEFADERALPFLYAVRPTYVGDPSLRNLFELGPEHGSFRATLIQDTGDLQILRFERKVK